MRVELIGIGIEDDFIVSEIPFWEFSININPKALYTMYILFSQVSVIDFRRSWEQMGSDCEVIENFSLQFRGLGDAVSGVIDFLGMQPCDGTHVVPVDADPKKTHMLHLSGVFIGNVSVLARAQVKLGGESGGALLRIAIRSEDQNISQLVSDFIQ